MKNIQNIQNIQCLIAIVERGKADHIVKEAKKVGASGATILYARGTGEAEALKFFNMSIKSQKEAIIMLIEEHNFEEVFKAIIKAGNLKEPGTGICFTLPINHLVGLHHREILRDLNLDEEN